MNGYFDRAEYTTPLWGKNWPERFGHPIEEYATLREATGALCFDGLEYVLARGTDAGSFLQGILSHDNLALAVGQSSPSWMLDSNGKITAHLRVFRSDKQEFLIQCLPGKAEDLSKALDRYIFMEDVKLEVETQWRTWSIQGAKAEILDNDSIQFQMPHSRCGEPGFDLVFESEMEVSVTATLQSAGIKPIGLTALDIRRVENFIPWMSVDMEMGKMPLIYGKGDAISYSKGCFLGQETVAMTRDRGRPPMLLCQLKGLGQNVPAPGTALVKEGRSAGTLTSILFSPEFEAPIALGCLQYSQAQNGFKLDDASGQTWEITQLAKWKSD